MKRKKTDKLWEKVFGILGCPAHVWKPNKVTTCRKGFCCFTCPFKSPTCLKERCPSTPNYCTVGPIGLEEVLELYESKEWKNYSEYALEVEKRARKKR